MILYEDRGVKYINDDCIESIRNIKRPSEMLSQTVIKMKSGEFFCIYQTADEYRLTMQRLELKEISCPGSIITTY
jgi:hypothetical protein